MENKSVPALVVNKKEVQKIAKKASKGLKGIPANFVTEAVNIVDTIGKVYIEGKKSDVEIARIHLQRDVLIEDIKQRYNLYNQVFTKIFDERKDVISKNFEIIEKGINENNENLISMGLENLSKVVTTSPFVAFADFQQQLQSGQAFEL